MKSESDSYIIGVDGGGSTCRVAIARADGTVIGSANGAAANPATSLSETVRTLLATIERARADAGIGTAQVAAAHAHFGLAGAINGEIAAQVASAMPIRSIRVTDDRPTNMAGALGRENGYLAAIGTGSFIGAQAGGAQRFIGGWGFELGDEASGARLGRQVLAALLRWQDGLCAESRLLTETLAGFGNDPSAVVLFGNEASPLDFAEFAPRVVAAALEGDVAGERIMRQGAGYIQTALQTLGHQKGAPLCLIGGLGPHYAAFLEPRFTRNMLAPAGTALDGALMLATEMAAVPQGAGS